MKFRYIGQEATEWFGFQWFPGTEHDVNDAHAIKKLSGSHLFEAIGEPVKTPIIASPAALEAAIGIHDEAVEPPQMPRRTRGPNKPKPEAQ